MTIISIKNKENNIIKIFVYFCTNIKSIIIILINHIFIFLIYTKYLFYFILFINSFILNLITYKIYNKYNDILIQQLYYTINLNGCGLIKFVQWANSQHELLFKNNKLLYKLFYNFYENCNIHNIEHTKKIFKNDFLKDIEDILIIDENYNIKSGSIAQVYKCYYNKDNPMNFMNKTNINDPVIIKVIHPELEYQIFWIKIVVKIYNYIMTNIKILNNWRIPFDDSFFFKNIKNQFNMINEYNNLQYYYNFYKDNDNIVIPKPIYGSNNFIIMSYEEGKSIDNKEDSDYIKYMIFILLNCFIKTNYFTCDILHNDMHTGNWKYRKYKNFYQLIIYDFGYCSENIVKYEIKELIYSIDNFNYKKILDILYKYLHNINFSKEFFIKNCDNIFSNTSNTNKMNSNIRICCINILLYINNNNFNISNSIIEILVNFILLDNMYSKYIIINNKDNIKYSRDYYLSHNIICKKYNIFNNIIEYHNNYYIDVESNNIKNKFLDEINIDDKKKIESSVITEVISI